MYSQLNARFPIPTTFLPSIYEGMVSFRLCFSESHPPVISIPPSTSRYVNSDDEAGADEGGFEDDEGLVDDVLDDEGSTADGVDVVVSDEVGTEVVVDSEEVCVFVGIEGVCVLVGFEEEGNKAAIPPEEAPPDGEGAEEAGSLSALPDARDEEEASPDCVSVNGESAEPKSPLSFSV